MRILLSTFDHAANFAGPAINYQRIIPKFLEHGIDVEVIVFDYGRSGHSRRLQKTGAVCHFISGRDDMGVKVRHVTNVVTSVNPDVFVADSMLTSLFAARWVQQAGIPVIGCMRSDDAFFAAVLRVFCKVNSPWKINHWVCVSGVLAEKVVCISASSVSVQIVPSGVPIPDSLAEHSAGFRIAYIGRLEQQQKQCAKVLDVVMSAIESGLCSQAVFFGEGPCRNELERRVEEFNLTEKIRFEGGVPPDEMKRELLGFQAVILMSDYEGMPGALLDGMSVGLVPIVSVIPGGVSELVVHEETGLVCQSENAVLMAIERLKDNPKLWLQLSRSARSLIEARYSLRGTVAAWIKLFTQLQTQPKKRRAVRVPWIMKLPAKEPALTIDM